MSGTNASRRETLRKVITIGSAIAVVGVTGSAHAAKNAAMRTALKYQDTPQGANQCSGCVQWVPGAKPTDLGGCKALPGDTEINPKGWCAAFVAAKK